MSENAGFTMIYSPNGHILGNRPFPPGQFFGQIFQTPGLVAPPMAWALGFSGLANIWTIYEHDNNIIYNNIITIWCQHIVNIIWNHMKPSEIIWTHMTLYDINIIEARDLADLEWSWQILAKRMNNRPRFSRDFHRFVPIRQRSAPSMAQPTSLVMLSRRSPPHLVKHPRRP